MAERARRLIRVSEARRRLPLGRTRFYQLIKDGRLPPIVKLPGGRAAFMDEAELDAVITTMIEGTQQAKE